MEIKLSHFICFWLSYVVFVDYPQNLQVVFCPNYVFGSCFRTLALAVTPVSDFYLCTHSDTDTVDFASP